jgi:hypothetical protein
MLGWLTHGLIVPSAHDFATLQDQRNVRQSPIAEIDQDDVLNVLKLMWFKRSQSAARFRNRIEAVLNHWATNNKMTHYANPAGFKILSLFCMGLSGARRWLKL